MRLISPLFLVFFLTDNTLSIQSLYIHLVFMEIAEIIMNSFDIHVVVTCTKVTCDFHKVTYKKFHYCNATFLWLVAFL